MKTLQVISLAIFILSSMVVPVLGQNLNVTGTAEVSVLPAGKIPIVRTGQNNYINLSFRDTLGVNWTNLQNFLPFPFTVFKGTPLGKFISFFITQILWANFLHRNWQPFLGYSKIQFSAEIVGNQTGWRTSIYPNTIAQSTDGTSAHLQLQINVEDTAISNTVTVRVKATRYLKDNSEYGTSNFDIPVRSQSLNYLIIQPIDSGKTVAPGSEINYQVRISNQGYFRDTFQVYVHSPDGIQGTVNEQSLVLDAGESKDVLLQLLTPETFYDPGTPHVINISVYSSSFPSDKFFGNILLTTQGTYVSGLVGIVAGFIIVLLIFLYFLFVIVRGRYEKNVYGRPEQPWKLPEEKPHLQELKRTDKAAYTRERRMMQDEYQSALLYHKDYRRSLKVKPIEEPPKTEEQPKKPVPKSTKKPEKPPKPEEKKVEAIVPVEDKAKEKALAKIQKEQEKALRKRNG